MSSGVPPVWRKPPRWCRGLCEGRCQTHWQFYTAHQQKLMVCTGSGRICTADRRRRSSRLGSVRLLPSRLLQRGLGCGFAGLIQVETAAYLGHVCACVSSDTSPTGRERCILVSSWERELGMLLIYGMRLDVHFCTEVYVRLHKPQEYSLACLTVWVDRWTSRLAAST